MTSANRTCFSLGLQGWLLLPLFFAASSSLPLQARPQQAAGAQSNQAPPPSSALMRWWKGLARHHVDVKEGDQGSFITESGWGIPERVYRITKDAEGRSHESYTENGQAKPVDEVVRRWAEATIQASHRSAPVPPEPPIPPVPPLPPTPPAFGKSETGQTFLRAIENDPRLANLLGSPLSVDELTRGSVTTWAPGEPHGFHLFSPTGGAKADVLASIHGPKGSAHLRAIGERKGTAWTFSRLEAQPSQGGARLNLLAK